MFCVSAPVLDMDHLLITSMINGNRSITLHIHVHMYGKKLWSGFTFVKINMLRR